MFSYPSPIHLPVLRRVCFSLAHVPGLVQAGSKPRREIAQQGPALFTDLRFHLRSFDQAVSYPPHQVMIGNLEPETLSSFHRPWHEHPMADAKAQGPAGTIIPNAHFYALLAKGDSAKLMRFKRVLPPCLEEALALQQVLQDLPDQAVDHLLGCGEEAVGDRYQRGGGNLVKAMGEMAQIHGAGGTDIKSFCAGPVHAMILGACLIASGMHHRVVVVGGGSLPKLGMKFQGHLRAGFPILEDVLVGVAIDMCGDDGVSPLVRLDCSAFHRLGQGSAAHQLTQALSYTPLSAQGLRLTDVDRFAGELHNPDITEPAGSGNVPENNYRILAAIAAMQGEILRQDMQKFIASRGLPGFSPTQGHIASAIPYLPQAIAAIRDGRLKRVQCVAKASLFLGRMTGSSDGASLLLEANPGPGSGQTAKGGAP